MPDDNSSEQTMKPLKIKCTSSDCSNNLHCFLSTKKLAAQGATGRCRSCGADLVNWQRVHQRSPSDVQHTFEALRLELVRHFFWHVPLTPKAINHARRKGKAALGTFANGQLRRLVGAPHHPLEGRQTPRETSVNANVIHFAQHATACCCRKCIAEWHGIPEGAALTDADLLYFTTLVMSYVNERIRDLTDSPVAIPPMRRARSARAKLESRLA
jgi:hypothetical protein